MSEQEFGPGYTRKRLEDIGGQLSITLGNILVLDRTIDALMVDADHLVQKGFDASDLGVGGLVQWKRVVGQYQIIVRTHGGGWESAAREALRILQLFVSDQRWIGELPLHSLASWRDRHGPDVAALAESSRTLIQACQGSQRIAEAALRAWVATNPYQKD